MLRRTPAPRRPRAVGRAAPDAGGRHGADVGTQPAGARRTVGRPVAGGSRKRCSRPSSPSRASGVSVLMIEQNALDALAISDRAYILVLGQNRQDGPAGPNSPKIPKFAPSSWVARGLRIVIETIIQLVANAIMSGAVLAVAAIGFTMMFAVLRFPNFSLAGHMVAGAYAGWPRQHHAGPAAAGRPPVRVPGRGRDRRRQRFHRAAPASPRGADHARHRLGRDLAVHRERAPLRLRQRSAQFRPCRWSATGSRAGCASGPSRSRMPGCRWRRWSSCSCCSP